MTTPTTNLRTWLTDLKRRNIRIHITGRIIHLDGLATRATDRHHIDQHRHALTCATTGTWTRWWNYVTGHTNQPPNPDEIPHHQPPNDSWTCACCSQPADRLDHLLLPWCDQHTPDYLTADLETA